jgi:hypothetical protein
MLLPLVTIGSATIRGSFQAIDRFNRINIPDPEGGPF